MSLLRVVFADDDLEAIKRRILWLSELAVEVACVDHFDGHRTHDDVALRPVMATA